MLPRLRLLALALVVPFALAACADAPQGMELDADAVVDGQIPAPPNVDGPPDNAETSDSGLAWIVLEPGDGETSPTPADMVRVHYTGWQTDGTMFDSSVVRGAPAEFPAGGLIPGWVEGLQLMTEGETRRFWIPAELAYGDEPAQPGAPSGLLVFDVQLIEVLSN
ncbi:MAG: FKBP-type peptidyl-prolyl cis-trans isomerase [Gemmatimonadales bacterium]|nr:MAG: FKBP-type peptidyl-prolyl cis-trans isomerase [Gemmatimonadales bacterium]